MTNVYIEIMNPKNLYANLAIDEPGQIADELFLAKLREELISSLSIHGVKNVIVKIIKDSHSTDYYKISIQNIKNDWQEEQIRIDSDDVCLSFMKKENLTKLKPDIIR